MARKILGCVLTFAKGHVCRLHEDSCSTSAGTVTVRSGVRHPHQDRVRYLPRAWWCAIGPHIGDDDCAVAELKLRSMVFTDPDPLFEPERVGQPRHCRPNIWIDKDRNYGCVRDRAVLLQRSTPVRSENGIQRIWWAI